MFDCVSGLLSTANIHGCILADDMGQVYLVLLLISYDIIALYCSLFLAYVDEAAFDAACSLGKTLQSITLLYTLLYQGFDGKPMVRKAIIVTPTSLVSNWEAEIKKWVGDRVRLVAMCESTRDDVISGIDNFISPRSSLQVKFATCLPSAFTA